jgi:hypothetical protein
MSGVFQTSARSVWRRVRGSAGALAASRGWRVRPGTERVPISGLASPLRYDLEVRRDFLGLCVDHASRGGECDESLTIQARSTAYWLWWTHVYCPRNAPELCEDPAARGRAFAERVRASFALCQSFAERGFDPQHPIVLREAERVLPTETGKTVTARLFAGDGCHRLALLWLAGQDALEAGQYVVRAQRALTPLDNTYLLRDALRDDPRAYLRFLASSYTDFEFGDVRDLLDWVRHNAPLRLPELTSVLRADALLSAE